MCSTLGLRLKMKTVQAIIVATAILHNICRDMNEKLPQDNSEVYEQLNEAEHLATHQEIDENDADHDHQDSTVRDSLINNYFGRR